MGRKVKQKSPGCFGTLVNAGYCYIHIDGNIPSFSDSSMVNRFRGCYFTYHDRLHICKKEAVLCANPRI